MHCIRRASPGHQHSECRGKRQAWLSALWSAFSSPLCIGSTRAETPGYLCIPSPSQRCPIDICRINNALLSPNIATNVSSIIGSSSYRDFKAAAGFSGELSPKVLCSLMVRIPSVHILCASTYDPETWTFTFSTLLNECRNIKFLQISYIYINIYPKQNMKWQHGVQAAKSIFWEFYINKQSSFSNK